MSTITRRALFRRAAAALAAPAVLRTTSAMAAALDTQIGSMLMLGFYGDTPGTQSAKALARHVRSGQAGGVVFLRHNVGSRRGVEQLTQTFRDAAGRRTALIAVDQEGGKVQRLGTKHGYGDVLEAGRVPGRYTPEKAAAMYEAAARELRQSGFNVNLAPTVDLHDPSNPVIGKYERAYGTDPAIVARYGGAFIDGMARAGVACVAKHFPGHGTSRGDSHDGFVDITRTWNQKELEPFRQLARTAPMVMGGHLVHDTLTGGEPVTFSEPALTGILREQLGFTGAIMTDDLDMGAIRNRYSMKDAVVSSVAAGNDIILISNSAKPDDDLAPKAVGWVRAAVKDGRIPMRRIEEAAARIEGVKRGVLAA